MNFNFEYTKESREKYSYILYHNVKVYVDPNDITVHIK